MLPFFVSLLLFCAIAQTNTMAPDVRSIRCVNNTNQTIVFLDAFGAEISVAPHNTTYATLYAPANLVWKVASAPAQTFCETRIINKTSKLVFSQPFAQQVVCSSELNLINWFIMRSRLMAKNTLSGLTFGIIPAHENEHISNADLNFCDTCFYVGATAAALTTLIATAAIINCTKTAAY